MEQLNSFADAFDQALKEVRDKVRTASNSVGVWESLKAFAAAVDWTEPWIVGLASAQVLLLGIALVFRGNLYVSAAIMAFAAGTIYGGEWLNAQLGRNWQRFSKQPYFDSNGIFFGAVVSAPLLLTMFVLLVSYLVSSSSLLIKLKRRELRHRARLRAAQERAAPAARADTRAEKRASERKGPGRTA